MQTATTKQARNAIRAAAKQCDIYLNGVSTTTGKGLQRTVKLFVQGGTSKPLFSAVAVADCAVQVAATAEALLNAQGLTANVFAMKSDRYGSHVRAICVVE